MPVMTALTYAFYAMGTLAAADAMLTKPPENKLTSTAEAAGGAPNRQAEAVFSTGQPTPKASAVPNAVQPTDPGATTAANSLALQVPNSPMGISGQNTVGSALIDAYAKEAQPLNIPNSPMPSAATGPAATPTPAGPGIGGILAGLNNAAGALEKVAPLLGLGEGPSRTLATAGAAGGQGGQNVFALPQRNTLAQILASLPRAYNG